MSVIDLLLLIFSFLSFTIATPPHVLKRGNASFVFPGDAPYTVNAATLAAALTCPNGNPTKSSPPVLLVHGTTSTGQETWGDGYVPALKASGYTACYVTLPGRAMGNMQVSAEYVAYNLHQISQLSGGLQTAVISHSQGGPNTQWALRFWPSTQKVTRGFVALSPDFAGIELADSKLSSICVDDLCQASIWQQSAGSNYYAAMHDDSFGEQVPTTAVWTSFDGVVNPPEENAQLPGAVVNSVQNLCPGRLTSHISMTVDAAAYAFALDALNNGGRASLSRVTKNAWTSCFKITASNMNVSVVKSLLSLFDSVVDGLILGMPRTSSEPAVMAYALNAEKRHLVEAN